MPSDLFISSSLLYFLTVLKSSVLVESDLQILVLGMETNLKAISRDIIDEQVLVFKLTI